MNENEKGMVDLYNQEMKELQDSKKQIEEMAKDMLEYGMEKYPTGDSVFTETKLREQFYHVFLTYAEHLIQKGYRKVQENALVLTREEHQKYLAFKIIEPQIRGCLDRERELEKRLETIRNETAERFAAQMKVLLSSNTYFVLANKEKLHKVIDEICKEITEGNK